MKRQEKGKRSRFKTVISVVVITLAMVELFVSHRLATEGEMVRELEMQAEDLEKQNQILKEKVALSGSLFELSVKAAEMNLSRSSKIVSYSPEIPVAFKP